MYFHVRFQNALEINKRPIFFPKGFYCSQNPVKFRWKHFMCIPCEDMHFRWSTSPFPLRMCILNEAYPHYWWGCAFPVRHIQHSRWRWIIIELRSSPRMAMWPTGNAHPHSRWRWITIELRSSQRMHILTGNAYSLYRVSLVQKVNSKT